MPGRVFTISTTSSRASIAARSGRADTCRQTGCTHPRINDVRAENREAHAGITKNIDGVKQDIRDVKQDVRMLTSHLLNRTAPPDARVR